MDELKLIRGKEIIINIENKPDKNIVLYQPSIDKICDFGEESFTNTFRHLCIIPSDIKSVLWDSGIDYMKISDFELFIMVSRGISNKDTSLILGDINLSEMIPMKKSENDEIVLYNQQEDYYIDEKIYEEMISYIRAMFGFVPKVEKAGNKFTKKILIDEDRDKRKNIKETEFQSIIVPQIITLVNTEELNYNYKTIFNLTLYQLNKSLWQVYKKKEKCALLQGRMSGFIDTSKIKPKDLQWMYEPEK